MTPRKRIVKEPKIKKIKLSTRERSLLRYPPNPDTWVCLEHEEPISLSGSQDRCYHCGVTKSKNPKLVWPEYVEACQKVFIEPGYMWKINEKTGEPIKRVKGESWQLSELPEGFQLINR